MCARVLCDDAARVEKTIMYIPNVGDSIYNTVQTGREYCSDGGCIELSCRLGLAYSTVKYSTVHYGK